VPIADFAVPWVGNGKTEGRRVPNEPLFPGDRRRFRLEISATHEGDTAMKRLMLAALLSAFTVVFASAEECTSVVNGKELKGAAKTSHMKSCCRKNAIDKNGNPMKGIVKKQFVDKCVHGA
jgi:hypothetical protein